MLRVALCSFLIFVAACGDDLPADNVGPQGPACGDGVDNDGDGKTDFPDDPGCESSTDETEDSAALPACSDHRDNDGDGKVDFPDDPGCLRPEEDDESDDCPDGPECPACANGIDDDVSGNSDYPADPSCESAGDTTEFNINPNACGTGLTIAQLPATGIVAGNLDGASTSMLLTKCGGGGGAAAHAYALVLTEPQIVVASTVDPMTTIDTVIDIRRANCADAKAEVACNDDSVGGTSSELTVSLDPGVYYVIVEGHDTSVTGPYQLTVKLFSAEGAECTMTSDCAPGLVCRIPSGETAMVCSQPVCNDGRDDDADGLTDFPLDPGCESPADNDETDDCPSGPNCPACSNDLDDDTDGLTDFPADLGCGAASSNIEGCGTEQDPILTISGPTTTGTTTGAHDDFTADACGSEGGLDLQYTLTLPEMRTLTLDTSGSSFDTIVTLRASTCGPQEIDCDDDGGTDATSALDVEDVPAGLYLVVVDGFNGDDSGAFTLAVSGEIAVGGSCEGGLFASGTIVCEGASTCQGTLGSRTCQTECSDGLDNNADGLIDFPNDPGCTSAADGVEDTVCPGANCPACSDTVDNDTDGDTDFPDDVSCDSAADTSELDCPSTEAVGVISTKITTGTTVGQTHDITPTCGSGSTAPDVHFQLDLPALKSLSLVLTPESGFDADIALFDQTCGPAELACGDGFSTDTISRTNVAAGRYFVEVDGDATTESGTFSIDLTGVIAQGGSCDSPLFTAGALTCDLGLPCTGAVGAKKCESQCSNGLDDDGDGLTDFPEEPGCTTIADDSETDNCPNGPGCPQCSNNIDDDGDGLTDFGADLDCVTAATNSEGSQCFQTDAVGVITSFFTNGTTTGKTDDIDLNCGSSSGTGPDTALSITVPKMRRLSLDLLLESGFDSVHALLTQQCTLPALLCRDPADLDFNNLAAGTYFVVVDGFNTSEFGVFTLLTSGEIEAGGSCEGPLFESGAFTCADSLPCEGTPGSRTCRSECSDGVDNNGGGLIDFPNDPGCASPSDLVEDTVCPGANCPQCADGLDNDTDGTIDFPADTSCASASDNTERACAVTEAVPALTTRVTNGTTTGQTNDIVPTCGSGSAAPDVHFQLDLPALTSLSLVLVPESGFDADLVFFNQTCGPAELVCRDASVGTETITQSNVAAGTYFVAVDGDATAEFGTFTLTTTGVIAPGGACTSPLFTDGALTCTAGQTCNGTVCQ